MGICKSEDCEAFNKEVICNCGFGAFDVKILSRVCFCPICENRVENVYNCGFFMAR